MTKTKEVKIIPAKEAPQPKETGVRGRPPKWPLDDMALGEAIEIPADKVQSLRQTCSNKNRTQKALPVEDQKQWMAGEAEDGKFYVWRYK